MSRIYTSLFLLLLLFVSRTVQGQAIPSPANSRALVIGIERYADESVHPGAVASAKAFASLLRDHLRVPEERIVVLLNEEAALERILTELARLYSQPEEERIYLYVAARSFTASRNPDVPGYILTHYGQVEPIDTVNNQRWTIRDGISMKKLLSNGEDTLRKEALVILDTPIGNLAGKYPRLPEGQKLDSLKVQHILTAGRAGETVPTDSLSALVRALRTGILAGRADVDSNRVITTHELAGYVRRVVPALTDNALHPQFRAINQTPGIIAVPTGSEAGDPGVIVAEQTPPAQEVPIRLDIVSNPTAADVSIDGESVGITPLMESLVTGHYGEISIVLRKPGYYSKEEIREVLPGDSVRIDQKLETVPVKVVLGGLPRTSQVIFDEHMVPTDPEGEYWLTPGKHKMIVHLNSSQDIKKTLKVERGSELSFDYHANAFSTGMAGRNVFPPGIGQFKRGSRLEGLLLLGTTAFLAGFITQNQRVYVDARRKYRSAIELYHSVSLESEVVARREEMFKQYNRTVYGTRNRDLGYGLMAAVWTYHMVDMLLFHSRVPALLPREAPGSLKTSFRLAPSPDGFASTLALQF